MNTKKATKAEVNANAAFTQEITETKNNLKQGSSLPPSSFDWDDEGTTIPHGKQYAKSWDFEKKGTLCAYWAGEIKTITPKEGGKPFDVMIFIDKKGQEWSTIKHSNLLKQVQEIGVNEVMWIDKGDKITLESGNKYQTYLIRTKAF